MRNGREIALSVDPETSNDVCTFCRHSTWEGGERGYGNPHCRLGYTPYFRSLSNYGALWVSDCGTGQLLPELEAAQPGRNVEGD